MRKMRIAIILLALLLTAVMFTGCPRIVKIPAETEPVTPDPGGTAGGDPDSFIPLNFDLDLLRESNTIGNLLRWNDSVTVRSAYDGGTDIHSFWLYDGERVCFTVNEIGDEVYESGSFRGFDFYVFADKPVTAERWVSAEEMTSPDWYDDSISGYLPETLAEEMVITAEEGDNYVVRLTEELDLGDGTTTRCVNTAVINKGTLFIQSYSWEYAIGDLLYGGSFEVEYDGGRLGMDVLAAWEGGRQVTVDVLTEAGARTESFPFPGLWQLRLLPDEGIHLSSPDGLEEEGSILIPADNVSVTVYARDEANLLGGDPDSVGSPAEGLPFSLAEFMDKNRISSLLTEHRSVSLVIHTDEYDQSSVYFRRGNDVVQYEQFLGEYDGQRISYFGGGFGNYRFESNPDATMVLYALLPPSTEEEGSYDDYAIVQPLQYAESGFISDVRETPDTFAFRFTYSFDGEASTYIDLTVDAETLLVQTIGYADSDVVTEVKLDEEIPFAEDLDHFYEDTRDIFVHYEDVGEVQYEVPAAWAFSVGYYSDISCWTDETCTTPMNNFIPADGENYEFWVTYGMG